MGKNLGAAVVTSLQNLSLRFSEVIFPPQGQFSQKQPGFNFKYPNNLATMFQGLSCSFFLKP